MDRLGADRHDRLRAGREGGHRPCGMDGQVRTEPDASIGADLALQEVRHAHEARHEQGAGPVVDLLGRADLCDASPIEDRDPVRHREPLALVMGHEDEGQAEPSVQRAKFELHLLAQVLVEGAQRFVEQDHPRLEHQRAGEGHALLLTARKLRGPAVAERAEPDPVERGRDTLPRLRLRNPAHLEREGDVLGDGHVREERVVLEYDTHATPVRRHRVDPDAVHRDPARTHRLEPGEHHQGGGLARPGRPEEAQELALHDVEVQLIDYLHGPVGLVDAVEADE